LIIDKSAQEREEKNKKTKEERNSLIADC